MQRNGPPSVPSLIVATGSPLHANSRLNASAIDWGVSKVVSSIPYHSGRISRFGRAPRGGPPHRHTSRGFKRPNVKNHCDRFTVDGPKPSKYLRFLWWLAS